MSDHYQAVYDAVRSKIQGFDMRTTFQDCLDFSREKQDLSIAIEMEREIRCRPSVVYRPNLARDGDQWSALYGDNIMVGVCGFGPSPEEAMADFDRAWNEKLQPAILDRAREASRP